MCRHPPGSKRDDTLFLYTALFRSDFTLPPGGIVGVIGPNGAGKSTLFKLITGKETPDGGTIEVGDTVKLGYVDQSRDHLNPDHNVWEKISGGHDLMTIRSEEHTSELQSLMRISYAVFCLNKK